MSEWDDGFGRGRFRRRASPREHGIDWEAMHGQIRGSLREAGVDADFRVTLHPTRQPRPPQWQAGGPARLTDTWIVTILLVQPVAQFLQGFFQESGSSAFHKLAELARGVSSAPSKAAQAVGDVRLTGVEGGQTLALPSRPSREAIEQLSELDWSAIGENATLVWEEGDRRWVAYASYSVT